MKTTASPQAATEEQRVRFASAITPARNARCDRTQIRVVQLAGLIAQIVIVGEFIRDTDSVCRDAELRQRLVVAALEELLTELLVLVDPDSPKLRGSREDVPTSDRSQPVTVAAFTRGPSVSSVRPSCSRFTCA